VGKSDVQPERDRWKTRSMLLPLEIQGLKEEEESHRVKSFTEIKHDKDYALDTGFSNREVTDQSGEWWVWKVDQGGKRTGWSWRGN